MNSCISSIVTTAFSRHCTGSRNR